MSGHTGGKAWLSGAGAMRAEAERVFPFETGGVLMGYWARAHDEVVITHVVGPGPHAEHRIHSFMPDYEYQEEEVARIYAASGRVATYLGDWHSHPLEDVYLSSRDRRTLGRIARHAEARAPVPVMAVVGGGDPKWLLSVWKYAPRLLVRIALDSRVVSMEPIIHEG